MVCRSKFKDAKETGMDAASWTPHRDSLRIVPGRETKPATVQDTSNSFGLRDTFNYGPRCLAAEVTKTSTLQMQRQLFGLHMSMRILMERKIVSQNPHMPILPQFNLHLDILMGRDEVLHCADFMGSAAEMLQPMDIHSDMEKMLRM
ncbi:hypothetical protein BD309DRAFT_878333 [Dichomitus squalens]|uniref:Proteasome maturation factor UMP1 n=2 Tax=Dichomitus squalens TaxID=114155 RepID=A0A4V2K659_9APHY|nr:uncharacterized protein DICSQDRAFT_175572 [Dichomitus squalens LYAD-421 SS1]TBU21168.1 hypothetical protein BD311DRAFT_679175 [Dichomitus squalens]EJF55744.1 hypothetical protein DICSQDRAFT_175572 [Dichomitus squalens LYAD-421 SS1]TBU36465.1 hypothetical protein BD309DRAFT_878333 [Dichomitus squalens]TBU51073.1 hypothetical protein BD310DRAFT_835403 [Dichomitus squalens]TBU51211.1 hypothetical protein BD310DRAFT_982810 [Dichomitus squalens]